MKRVLRTTFSTLLILVLCIGMLTPVASAEEIPAGHYKNVDLSGYKWMPITVNVTGSEPAEGSQITFKITSLTEGAPAVPGDLDLTFDLAEGVNTFNIGFPITQMGVFEYLVEVESCSYTVNQDKFKFVVYSLAEGYEDQVACFNESNVKCEAIYNIELLTLNVSKIWNCNGTIPPANIWVDLIVDKEVVKTIKISGPDWKGSFTGLQSGVKYTIKEHAVPGFAASYRFDAATNTWVITNSSSLLQTGQLNWPIPVLAAAGMLFVALGYLLMRKKDEKNA